MTELPTNQPASPVEQTPEETIVPRRPLCIAWVAGERTLWRLGAVLKPLSIALLDELVELHAFCPEGADARSLPTPPVEVIRYSRPRWWEMPTGNTGSLVREARTRQIELVHALDSSGVKLARRLAAGANVPCIVGSFGLDDASKLIGGAGSISAVLAGGEQIQRALLEKRVVPADRVYLVRPGLVRVRRPTCFQDPEKSAAVVAGTVLDDFTCYDAVLRSFAAVRQAGHDCSFFIVGSGRAEHRLRARAEYLGLGGELTFVASQPAWQLAGIFKAAADVFISPAPQQRLDMPALLAMAAGVPVISVRSQASDFLKDGRTTAQFIAGDDSELTTKLLGLLNDRAAARGLAEGALEHLRKNHSSSEACNKTADLYQQVVTEWELAVAKQNAHAQAGV